MLEGAKLIGVGATTIAIAGAAIGIGNVFSSLIHSVARNPLLAKQLFGYAILCFALTKAIALFASMMEKEGIWKKKEYGHGSGFHSYIFGTTPQRFIVCNNFWPRGLGLGKDPFGGGGRGGNTGCSRWPFDGGGHGGNT